jgi:copper homeostasis protein
VSVVPRVEICVDDLSGALAAEQAGADRIELCAALSEGGITPSIGLIRAVLGRLRRIGVVVMIRPRGGNFHVTAEERAVMLADIAAIRAEPHAPGVTVGFVFGALNADGTIDAPTAQALVAASAGAPVTFHKAFDETTDLPAALDTLMALGVNRVLTSGGASTAAAGRAMLRALVAQSAGRITILGGGGVRAHNLRALLAETGVPEVHLRAMRPDTFGRPVTVAEDIAAVLRVARGTA